MVEQLAVLRDADRSLFPSSFTIRALRDSRYHNTAYAIAELIDNSIEAGAPLIELLCMEEAQMGRERMRRLVSEVAVLDNGTGMDVTTLLEALKFGGGTRHDSDRGIGKYGMGLPTSSMSQCKRVDVWTWQDGPNSVWHSVEIRHRVSWTKFNGKPVVPTISGVEITLSLFPTARHPFPRHGDGQAAMRFTKIAPALLSYGASWTKFNGKPVAR